MHHQLITAANVLAAANNSSHFSIGPWIIVPILILIAIIATLIYIVRDRRKRHAND
ncbi:MAG: hypothetical protein ACRDPY_32710 [Streptosporangiaceae bacterium]